MKTNSTTATSTSATLAASFRDPAGFMYHDKDGSLLRQVNKVGATDFDLFVQGGLYQTLVDKKQLVSHKVLPLSKALDKKTAHTLLQPQVVPFISYPFEWSFSQLQDAALLTLSIQKRALARGMTLKDASAYNIQFVDGQPIFIDTLSFEAYKPGEPWQAYRQFCQHFLAPLALMAYTDHNLSQLLRVHLDGIPLDLTSKLLPRTAKVRPSIAMHVVVHAKAQNAKAKQHQRPSREVKQSALEAIILNLEHSILKLRPKKVASEWGRYYEITNYSDDAADQKVKLIKDFVKPLKAATAVDLGGNDGRYSRVLHSLGLQTVCADVDYNAVEANYRHIKKHKETAMLPLVVDLTNPGGALGWHNQERAPLHERLQADLVMALALVHHLAISNNLPFVRIAEYLGEFAPQVLIEFVPKEDSQVKKLLATRKDIFPDYHAEGLQAAFAQAGFKLVKQAPIEGSERTLYLFKKK